MNLDKISEYAAKRIAEIAADASMSEREKANRIIAVVENETQQKIGLVIDII